jgi:nucleoid-associated protein YgaU
MRTFDLETTAENRRNWRVSDVLIKFGGVVFCALLVAIPAKAQDVAAAARAARDREASTHHATHVYTNEDLTAPEILTPEDQARFASARDVWEAPKGWQLADILPPDVEPAVPPAPPLGDVARNIRVAKEIQRITVPTYVPTPTYASPARPRAIEGISGNGATPSIPLFTNSAAPFVHGGSTIAPAAPNAPATMHATPEMISHFSSATPTAPLGHSAGMHAAPQASHPAFHPGVAPMLSYSAARAFPHALSTPSATLAAPHASVQAAPHALVNAAPHAAAQTPHAVPQVTVHAVPQAVVHAAPQAAVDAAIHASVHATVHATPSSMNHAAHLLKPVAPAANAVAGTVQIQPGQTLWRLATEYLGSGYRWHQIAELNPSLSDPTRIEAGTAIRMPQPTMQTPGTRKSIGNYLVQSGDSMWKIAQAQLGNAGAWVCVAHANPDVQNPNLIFPGQAINLPALGESEHCE